MNLNLRAASATVLLEFVGVVAFQIFGLQKASAQPTIVSTVPVNLASGVSPSAVVVFTFSESMDTTKTSVQFLALPSTTLTTSQDWSQSDTVLTCTPDPAFPSHTNVIWSITGHDLAGMSLSGATSGIFITGGSSGSDTGSGTNAITTFVAGKSYLYLQNTADAPTPSDPTYAFIATTTLSSNRTANTIAVSLPSGGTSNLQQNFVLPYEYLLFAYDTNNARFEAAFPEGSYVFNVTSSSSNQLVTVTLPSDMTQPNAPHISNYTAAQNVDVSLAFTLTWDSFQGGTSADYILVTVGDKVWRTPSPGTNGALTGTATSAITLPRSFSIIQQAPATRPMPRGHIGPRPLNFISTQRAQPPQCHL
jgi:hypothetical protein